VSARASEYEKCAIKKELLALVHQALDGDFIGINSQSKT